MCIVHALPYEMKSWQRAGRCASWSLYCFFGDRSRSKRTRAAGGIMVGRWSWETGPASRVFVVRTASSNPAGRSRRVGALEGLLVIDVVVVIGIDR